MILQRIVFVLIILFQLNGYSQEVPSQGNPSGSLLDENVKLDQKEKISTVFRDLVVVQRKAKDKAHHYLFSPTLNFDFSDGPVTMYSLNLNFGYALSDFWEVYFNYVPSFVKNERDMIKKVSDLAIKNGMPPLTINYSKPMTQMGLSVLWAPAYGKDSWGPYSIIRSDTFFKLGIMQIAYENNSGMRYDFQLGKTFFISKWWNLRVSAGLNQIESYLDSIRSTSVIAVMEGGFVYYF